MKVKSTLLYGASGSFEEVTIKKWKKLRVLAHKASGNFTNITQRVLDQRSAMAMTVALFKLVASTVYQGWKEYKSYPGEYASFVSYILKNAISFMTPGSPSLTYANIRIAKGSMPSTPILTASSDASSNNVVLTYDTNAGYKQADTDLIGVAVYNITQSKWLLYLGAETRADGTVTITTPTGFAITGNTLAIHTFFYGAESTDTAGTASDDVIASATVVA